MGERLWMRGPARASLRAFTMGALVVGCTSDPSPAARPSPPSELEVGSAAAADSAAKAPPLDLGGLTVKATTSGFAASADDAERCASSEWHLTGEVEYRQASPVPDQCFGGPHAFDTTWYGLTLPPGDYVISLTVRRGLSTGTASQAFTIAGA